MTTSRWEMTIFFKSIILSLILSSLCYAEWDFAVSAGYGQRSNPLIQSEPIDILVNIDIAWFGERIFFDNGDFGYALKSTDSSSFNLVTTINNERNFFSRTNTRFITVSSGQLETPEPANPPTNNPVPTLPGDNPAPPASDNDDGFLISIPDRDYALEAGFEYLKDLPNGSFSVSVLSDISKTHHGLKSSFSYQWQRIYRRWHIASSIGSSWQSSKLNDYYYGVTEAEANQRLQRFSVQSGFNHHGNLIIRYALSPSLFLGLHMGIETLSDSIADSPLIDESTVTTIFSGIKYQF